MNPELIRKASDLVGNPHVLVNLLSRRVRQLTSGHGGICRPLIADCGNLDAGDIALREIIEGKMGWELPPIVKNVRPAPKKRHGHRPLPKL